MEDRYELIKIEKLNWMFHAVIESYSIHPVGFYDELMLFLDEVLVAQNQIDFYVAEEYPIVFIDIKEIKKYFHKTLISAQEKTWVESLLNPKFGFSNPYEIVPSAIQYMSSDEVIRYKHKYPKVFHKYLSNKVEYNEYR